MFIHLFHFLKWIFQFWFAIAFPVNYIVYSVAKFKHLLKNVHLFNSIRRCWLPIGSLMKNIVYSVAKWKQMKCMTNIERCLFVQFLWIFESGFLMNCIVYSVAKLKHLLKNVDLFHFYEFLN